MKLFSTLSLGAVLVTLAVPSAFAKIYPDDFQIQPVPSSIASSSSSSSSSSAVPPVPMTVRETPPAPSQPFFYVSDIPNGRLTRSQFVDALATRLNDADAHDKCFAGLVLSENFDYQLLFSDVSLDAPFASSACVLMRTGIMQGYSNGMFRPDRQITVAEAAAMLGDIGGMSLRDSNHMRFGEAWYQRYMDAMRGVDHQFTMAPQEIMTGAQLRIPSASSRESRRHWIRWGSSGGASHGSRRCATQRSSP